MGGADLAVLLDLPLGDDDQRRRPARRREAARGGGEGGRQRQRGRRRHCLLSWIASPLLALFLIHYCTRLARAIGSRPLPGPFLG